MVASKISISQKQWTRGRRLPIKRIRPKKRFFLSFSKERLKTNKATMDTTTEATYAAQTSATQARKDTAKKATAEAYTYAEAAEATQAATTQATELTLATEAGDVHTIPGWSDREEETKQRKKVRLALLS